MVWNSFACLVDGWMEGGRAGWMDGVIDGDLRCLLVSFIMFINLFISD